MPPAANACQTCGACCAHYRVSFHWREADQRGLDDGSLVQISPWHVCFAGTEKHPVRCAHLVGDVGGQVACRVYDQRPGPCRSVEPGDQQCLKARAAHGLPAL